MVELVIIEALMDISPSNETSATLRVDPIHLPHCSFAYLEQNGTVLALGRGPVDENLSGVVLIWYPQQPSFSGGGDDTLVLLFDDDQHASIPDALNRTTHAYYLDPRYTFLFSGPSASTDWHRGPAEWSYTVQGNLTLYPDFYPGTEGVFQVKETHTLVSQTRVAVEWRQMGCE